MVNIPHEPLGGYFDPFGLTQSFSGIDGSLLSPHHGFHSPAPPVASPVQVTNTPTSSAQQQTSIDALFCTQVPCPVTFKRDSDRIRHETAVHGINKATY